MRLKQHKFLPLSFYTAATKRCAAAEPQPRVVAESIILCMRVFTFSQDLWNLGVAGAEGAVDFKAIGIIQEGAAQGEEHFLWKYEQVMQHK